MLGMRAPRGVSERDTASREVCSVGRRGSALTMPSLWPLHDQDVSNNISCTSRPIQYLLYTLQQCALAFILFFFVVVVFASQVLENMLVRGKTYKVIWALSIILLAQHVHYFVT